MLNESDLKELKLTSLNVRKNIVKMVHSAKSGHPGGSLSGADILTVLYKKCLFIPEDWDNSPDFEKRDRFILSKGHASPLLYSINLIKIRQMFLYTQVTENYKKAPAGKHLCKPLIGI